jgi:hypothetical protein
LNTERDIRDAMVRAATGKHGAIEVSTIEIHRISHFACQANDALAFIRMACEQAVAQGGGINPKSILDFLTLNNLMLKELSDAQITTEDQGCEPAGAAVA